MASSVVETAFRLRAVRWVIGTLVLLRGVVELHFGRVYEATVALCWVYRVSDIQPLRTLARSRVFSVIASAGDGRRNRLVDAYLAHPASHAHLATYTLAGGHRDLFRDVMVLKAATSSQKGVILLKYAQTFDAMQGAFDVRRLMEHYVFVLEPCWAGYCDPSLLMYVTPGQPVFVQCFTADDRQFIDSIGHPFIGVPLGPADWVDSNLFRPRSGGAPSHDLVMVANWARHKRHRQLFRALADIKERPIRVLLIGFPFGGRRADDIRREAAALAGSNVTIEIEENLPASEVADRVARCRAFVFLSRKEGDNKALVEAMFANVPAIVFADSVGGARSRINPATGVLASDEQLASTIIDVLDDLDRFQPREWALKHTGSANATRVLEQALWIEAQRSGTPWERRLAEKTNAPNLTYKVPAERQRFRADYDFIRSCRREARPST